MSINTPQGPRQSGASFRDLIDIASALWRFLTRTTLGAIIAIVLSVYLLFSFAQFAVPRTALYMAQSREGDGEDKKEKKEGPRICLLLVIDATEKCLDDPLLPRPDGDLAGQSMTDATPKSILLPPGSVDGYFENYNGLTVTIWKAAVADASGDDEHARRQCITQIITDRWGEKNTFAAYSGLESERDVVKKQIGWFVKPIVRLKVPDYTVNINGQTFVPLAPARVEETCDKE